MDLKDKYFDNVNNLQIWVLSFLYDRSVFFTRRLAVSKSLYNSFLSFINPSLIIISSVRAECIST